MATVRPAEAADLPTIAVLAGEFRAHWGRAEPSAQAIERGVGRLQEDPDAEFLLAAPACGFALLRFRFSLWTDSPECELEDLYVRRAERGAGLGRALVELSLERARERGCRRMDIVGNETNTPALALYRSLGFSAWFDPPGGHNLILRRAL